MSGKQNILQLKWIHTSDIHGYVFGDNRLRGDRIGGGALSVIHSYVRAQKEIYGEGVILSDGGDCLQGSPLVYYYNFVETNAPHFIAEVMNEAGYDCGVMGNHDIEVGEKTFERWKNDCNFPILGANVIDKRTRKPYLQPFIIINRSGIKIAILGMVTSMIKYYQPNTLWPDLEYEEITDSAKRWIDVIQKQEHPDLLVGLFHSGYEGLFDVKGVCQENVVKNVAEQVPGFDLICYGHDHVPSVHRVKNIEGNEVVCMGSTCSYGYFSAADITLTIQDGGIISKSIDTKLLNIYKDIQISINGIYTFENKFAPQVQKAVEWADMQLCQLTRPMHEQEAYFGPCLFMDYIHQTQMNMTGAEISFATPYSYNSRLNGKLKVRDIFPLLAYEEFVYSIKLTGEEIRKMIEMSYGKWINTIHSSADNLISIYNYNKNANLIKKLKRIIKRLFITRTKVSNWRPVCPTSDMFTAAGVVYTVDVTKPVGKRVKIESMIDGSEFVEQQYYKVAINRRLLFDKDGIIAKGAGLGQKDIPSRIISISEKAIPYYMMQQMEMQKEVFPQLISNWHFVPEEIVTKAIARDREILFPSNVIQEISNNYFKI